MKKEKKSELIVGKKHRKRGGGKENRDGEIQNALIFIEKVWNKQTKKK